ncbi:MAG TPA: FAD:protein FMN transferase [Xanthomonadales bacterium]|nr:FAD:protein FMN transferase [Xanthomonadales bacterium]
MVNRAFPLLLALVLAASACVRNDDQRAEFFVFGTLLEVQLPGTDADTANEIFALLQFEFQRMHGEWHAWEMSELVRLNSALQSGETTLTTPDILYLIQRSQELEQSSKGRFNPAIGKLIALWGFHTSEFPIMGPPPDSREIEALTDRSPSSLDIVVAGENVRSENPYVQLDFGGVAKGYAVDLAIRIIRQSGIDSAIVNAGGDMRTLGDNAGKPWKVGVQEPAGGFAGGIEVNGDYAVFTSGNYTRFRQDAEQRYPHILDPQTGWPVNSVASATVIANDGTTADAAATAIMVAGLKDWPEVASAMGILAAMVIDESGEIYATQAMMDFFTPGSDRSMTVLPVPSKAD